MLICFKVQQLICQTEVHPGCYSCNIGKGITWQGIRKQQMIETELFFANALKLNDSRENLPHFLKMASGT